MLIRSILLTTRVVCSIGFCTIGMPATATIAQAAPVLAPPAQTQHCALICAPAFTFTPALIRSHVFGTARVPALSNTAVTNIPA